MVCCLLIVPERLVVMTVTHNNLAHADAGSNTAAADSSSLPGEARLERIKALTEQPMARVDQVIREALDSHVVLINQIADYIIGSGGKRLRPVIHLLAAGACGYDGRHESRLAAIIEFIHTATLLHDDVVDESSLRRGRETANAVWGNAASVLVGDFLYSRSFQMMVDVDSMRVMDILAETTNVIAEGEVLQLLHLHNTETTEDGYREVIRCKTAKLFEAAARLGAVIADADAATEQALASYGMELGAAFQLADDMLDYTGTADELGKNVGDDLAEGKPTLPLIYLLQRGSDEQQQLVREVIEAGDRERLPEVVAAIADSPALRYTQTQAEQAAERAISALAPLPQSAHREALIDLARYAVERRH